VVESEPATLVLLDGAPGTVSLSRWDAIDAGYVVLDDDQFMADVAAVRPAESARSESVPSAESELSARLNS